MRPVLKTVVLAVALLGVGIWSDPGVAREQQAPSSHVVLDLPDGYKPSQLFSGFTDDALGVSIIVLELPGEAYEKVSKGLTADALAAKGVKDAKPMQLTRPQPYVYMRAVQATDRGEYEKRLLVIHQRGVTALITANIEASRLKSGEITEDQITAIMNSAHIAVSPAPSKDVFQLDYLGSFKPAATVLGTTRLYTLDGKQANGKKPHKVVLIVAPSLDRRLVPPNETYAERLLEGVPGLEKFKIEAQRTTEIAGLKAVELEATAQDKDTGGELALYQVLILGKQGGYYRIFGQAPVADRDVLMPEFRKIAQSFHPVE
ncbi:MAG: hypothetical protein ACK5JT_19755 [Hyphomicrobiaceae bacterium]